MKKFSKALLIAICILLAMGLVCIGAGIVLGGDFGGIINDILTDAIARIQGTPIQLPDIK